jgi:dTDP-4-dehydrorhamnose 3,5-epimerase-like enzyme
MLGNAAALEQHCAASDLRGVGGKNRHDSYFAQNSQCLISVEPGSAHSFQRASERTFQRRLLSMQLSGAAPPFAMRSLRQIGEFEINRKRFGDAVGFFNGQARDNVPRLDKQGILKFEIIQIRTCSVRARLLAMLNENTP